MAENNDLYDFDNMPSTEMKGPAIIDTPGINHNLQVKFEIVGGDIKKGDNAGSKWEAFQVTVINPDGKEFREIYFAPPSKEDDVKFKVKYYELVEGKMTETREATAKETMRILNNEFMAYLLDLGEAIGYNLNDVKEHLYKTAKAGGGFKGLCQAFLDKFRPSDSTRISAKILWQNNTKKETSFLRMHGAFTVYYPFGNDIFDVYKEGRPTLLKLSSYEEKVGLKKEFTSGSTDAPSGTGAVNKTWSANDAKGATGSTGTMFNKDDEDPF